MALDASATLIQNVSARRAGLAGLGVVLSLSVVTSTWAQQTPGHSRETGQPYVTCYNQKEFKGSAQSWVFAEDDRGVLYVGNNIGVLEFDGTSWRRVAAGGGDVVRGVAKGQDGRMYVGSTGDFGYIAPDEVGATHYVSLLEHVDEELRDFNDIWAVHATNDGVYFLARERLFRVTPIEGSGADGATTEWRVTSWEPEARFLFSFFADDSFYVHQGGVGLMKMVEDTLQLIPGGEMFADERLQVMLPLPDKEVGEFVVGSFNRGLFVYHENGFKPFESAANPYLRANTLYKGARLPDGSYALATLDGGLIVIESDGRPLTTIDLSLGLPSNSIIAVFVDRDGGLWFSPETGICRVEAPSPLSYFDASNGLVGGVLGMARHNGVMYVTTGNGIFYLDVSTSGFKRVRGLLPGNPQSFTLLPVGDLLFAATGTGIYRIEGDRAFVVKENVGGSFASTGLHRSRRDSSLVFVGLVDGLAVLSLDRTGRARYDGERVTGLQKDIWTFAEPNPGTLWAGTRTGGVARVDYGDDPTDNVTITNMGAESGLPPGLALTFEVGGRVAVMTKVGVYSFDAESQRFERDNRLNVIGFDGLQEEVWMTEASNGDVWVGAGPEAAVVRRQTDGSFVAEHTPVLRVAEVTAAFIHADEDGVVWFGGTESLLRYDPSVEKNYSTDYPALVRRVTTVDDSLVFGGTHRDAQQSIWPALDYVNNAVRIEYSAVTFDRPSQTRFRSKLDGFDERWSSWTTDSWREYTNLPPGDYTFRVRARNVYGHESQEGSYAFTIAPPWYRTWWAYGFYLVLLGAGVFAADRVQRRRLIKKERARVQLREAKLRAEAAEANTKALQAENERNQHVELLSEVGRAITATLSIEQIMDTVYQNVNALMDASIFGIGVYNEAQQTLDFPATKEKGETLASFSNSLEDDNRLAVWCFKNQEEIVIQDFRRDHQRYIRELQPPIEGEDPESVLYLPLTHQDKTIGVITAQSFAKEAYQEHHLNILRNLATYTAIALDNAEAYRKLGDTQKRLLEEQRSRLVLLEEENQRKTKELEGARDLQLSMLPEQMPDTPEYDIAAYMKTATEVGGDYYDFSKAADGSLIVVIGDATGHGINSGMVVTTMKSLFFSGVAKSETLTFFDDCNATFDEIFDGNLLMGLQLLRIKDRKLSIATAGIPPAYLYRSESQEVEEIFIKAMPLGAFPGFPYEQEEYQLHPGDTILLASDGFAELFNDKEEMFGYDETKVLFGAIAEKPAQEIIDELVKAGDTWANGRPNEDDVTFVVVKVI